VNGATVTVTVTLALRISLRITLQDANDTIRNWVPREIHLPKKKGKKNGDSDKENKGVKRKVKTVSREGGGEGKDDQGLSRKRQQVW